MVYLGCLDFIVVNERTGNAVAAFLGPTDAHRFIDGRQKMEGPHGPSYRVLNSDGSPLNAWSSTGE